MLIHPHDMARDDGEWRAFLDSHRFGHLIAAGVGREVPVVVPTQFSLQGDDVLLHLAKGNPIWRAIDENPMVVLSVAGDWAYIPSDWKAVGDEDPRAGIPTTYYAAVQLVASAHTVDEVASVLSIQLADLQPHTEVIDPVEHGAKLRAIRGMRLVVVDVRAKFKYGGNVDAEHRAAVLARLDARKGPGDAAAASHLRRRMRAN